MAEYIIQKAVAPSAVKKPLQRSLEEYGRTFLAQPKHDGCCAVMTVTPYAAPVTQSRTGEPVRSMGLAEEVVASWDALRECWAHRGGVVLIGEAWWPGKDQFSLISGDFRRHSRSDKLGFIINDCLLADEFAAGRSDVPYERRLTRLDDAEEEHWCGRVASFPAGSYGDPQAMCNAWVDKGGFDGLVLRDPQGTWTRGRGTTGEIVKLKRLLSFDLRVIGSEPGKGKHAGRMGALVVDFGGKRLSVGTGFTDAEREAPPPVGSIVEVEAMDYSSDGLLREPRYKGARFDKLEPDQIAA